VVIGVPAEEDEPWSEEEDEPWSEEDEVVPVSSDDEDEVVPVSPDDVLLPWAMVVVWFPIEPETPITPKAIAKVASEVTQTRRRIARSRSARSRSFSAACSRGEEALGFMPHMVGRQPKHRLKAGWEVPECGQVA
jgi:hypothetical protein